MGRYSIQVYLFIVLIGLSQSAFSQGLTVTGAVNSSTLSVTGLAQAANLSVTGTIQGGTFSGTLGSGTLNSITSLGNLTALTVTGTTTLSQLTVTNNMTATTINGTINTAAQPNITSVGSLTNLSVAGTIQLSSIVTTGKITITGITSVTINQTGDTYGESGVIIQNANGANGAIYYTNGSVALVDFGFLTKTSTPANLQYNFRFETRSGTSNAANVNGEFELLPAATGVPFAIFSEYYNAWTPLATGTILIGAAAGTGTITLGSSSAAQSVNIANGAGNSTVKIANVTNTNNTVSIGDPQATAATVPVGTIKLAGANVVSSGAFNYGGTSTGSANAQAITLSPAITGPATGQIVSFKAGFAISVTNPTLNVNGTGAKTIVKRGAAVLGTTDILVNGYYICIYNGTQWQLINPTVP